MEEAGLHQDLEEEEGPLPTEVEISGEEGQDRDMEVIREDTILAKVTIPLNAILNYSLRRI